MDHWPSTRPLTALGFLYPQNKWNKSFGYSSFPARKNTVCQQQHQPTVFTHRAATALEELTEALKNPTAAQPFLNTSNKLNAAIGWFPLEPVLSERVMEVRDTSR
jgi:hypothetical protein